MRLALAIGTPGKNRDDSSAEAEQRDAVPGSASVLWSNYASGH